MLVLRKTLVPAGLTLVIINKKLMTDRPKASSIMNYKKICENDSMLNTPPTFCVYVASLVLEWIKSLGGVSTMEKNAKEKSALLYDYIDSTNFYKNLIEFNSRSRMNVPFNISNASLNDSFLSEAIDNGLFELKGHRSVGGFRASIYNAMPIEGVKVLINFMKDLRGNMDKYNVKTYNSISHLGLEKIKDLGLSIDSGKTANAILLRSHKLSSEEIEETVYGVFQAGAGTNNIPIDFCTSKGIAVFNTPGANAVKELVILSILVSSRNIFRAKFSS